MTAPSQDGAGTVLVGRAAQAEVLRARLAATCAGDGGLAWVRGEAGIGKTTLLEALGAEAEELGCSVLRGQGWDDAGTPPFWIWTQVPGSRHPFRRCHRGHGHGGTDQPAAGHLRRVVDAGGRGADRGSLGTCPRGRLRGRPAAVAREPALMDGAGPGVPR